MASVIAFLKTESMSFCALKREPFSLSIYKTISCFCYLQTWLTCAATQVGKTILKDFLFQTTLMTSSNMCTSVHPTTFFMSNSATEYFTSLFWATAILSLVKNIASTFHDVTILFKRLLRSHRGAWQADSTMLGEPNIDRKTGTESLGLVNREDQFLHTFTLPGIDGGCLGPSCPRQIAFSYVLDKPTQYSTKRAGRALQCHFSRTETWKAPNKQCIRLICSFHDQLQITQIDGHNVL